MRLCASSNACLYVPCSKASALADRSGLFARTVRPCTTPGEFFVTGKPRVTENDSTKADLCCVATKKTPSDKHSGGFVSRS
jgi:hypothetical protein